MDDEERTGSPLELDRMRKDPKRKDTTEMSSNERVMMSRHQKLDSNEEYQASSTNSALIEIIGVDPNEAGSSKMLSSKDDRQHRGQYTDKAETELKEVLDQMRELELIHEAEMEEMYKKQTEIMQAMIKMQGQYIQKMNEMQHQVDQLKRKEKCCMMGSKMSTLDSS